MSKRMGFIGLFCVISLSLLTACQQTRTTPNAHQQHVALNTKASTINVQLGMGYLQKGNMTRAKEKLLLALQQDPKSAMAHDAMAYFLEKSGSVDSAKEHFRLAIRYGGNKGEHLNNYGTFLCRQGQYQESEKYFIRATNDPNYVNVADAFENAGMCSEHIPDQQKALMYYQQALQREPQRPSILLSLAKVYFETHQYGAAEKQLNAYRSVAEATAETTYLSYRLALKLGQRELAQNYARVLQSQFANSSEFRQYQQSRGVTA